MMNDNHESNTATVLCQDDAPPIDPDVLRLARRFGVEKALTNPPPDDSKERERQRSLDLDRSRDRPRLKPKRPDLKAEVFRELGGSLLGPRFAFAIVAISDFRRLRPMTRLFFASFLWSYQPGRVWRQTARDLGSAIGLEGRTCERATVELKRMGYLARYGRGWICPPVEMKLDPTDRVWKEQLAFDFVPDWETVNPAAARYLGLAK